MKTKKYNEVVEYYKQGSDECQKISDEQHAMLSKAHKAAKKVVNESLDKFTDCLEEKAKDWSAEDYDQFIDMAEHDTRLGSIGILTISTAYAKVHEDDKERVHNNVCKKAMLEVALHNLGSILNDIR